MPNSGQVTSHFGALSIPRLALQDLRGLVVIDEIQRLSSAQWEGFMKQA